MAIVFDRVNQIIEVEAPATEVTVQELLDACREYEDELSSIDLPQIAYASGKEELGGGVTVGVTLMLMDWKVKFEERTEWTVCNISGGNLVCYDSTLTQYVTPIEPSAYVTATLTASSSATTADLDAIQYASYQNAVWVDTGSSNSGTAYPMGTREYPLNNITDAVSVANTKGFSTFQLLSDITIDSGTVLTGFELVGKSHVDTAVILLNTVSCANITIKNCNIGGELDGGTIIYDCMVGDLNYFNGHIHHSGLYGTITLDGNADAVVENCFTVDQDFAPEIDMGGSGQSLSMPNYSGLVTISNLTSASEEVGIGINAGQITLDSTITAGTIIISGVGILIDNSTGTASVNSDGLLNRETITKTTWDTVYIDTTYGTSGTTFPLGTAGNPVDNITDARTIADANNIRSYYIRGSITLDQNHDNWVFTGTGTATVDTVNIAGYSISSSRFDLLTIVGSMLGSNAFFETCTLYDFSGMNGAVQNSNIGGTLTASSSPGTMIIGNNLMVASATVTVDANGGNFRMINLGFDVGDWILKNASWGSSPPDTMTLCQFYGESGSLTIDSSCTGGVLVVDGLMRSFTNNGSMMTTSTGLLNQDSVGNVVWDETLADHIATGSTGEALDNVSGGSSPETIASAVWDTATSSHTTSGTFGEKIGKKLLTFAKWIGLK